MQCFHTERFKEDQPNRLLLDCVGLHDKEFEGIEHSSCLPVHRFSCLVQNVLVDFCFRQELLKWNGWGYKDSKFVVENRVISFTGNRYVVSFRVVLSKWVCMICFYVSKVTALVISVARYAIGELSLPFFTKWVLDKFDIDWDSARSSQPMPKDDNLPSPIVDAGTVQFCDLDLVLSTLFQSIFKYF